MIMLSIDSGINGGLSIFDGSTFKYSLPMPTYKNVVKKKLMQLDLKDGKKQVIKSGPNKGQFKMKVRSPEKTKTELNILEILFLMEESDVIIIERQNPRPGNSASSSFTTGINYGKLLACVELSGTKKVIVNPNVWKKYLKLSDDKLKSVEMAESLTGKSFRTKRGRLKHDEAESMLIGHWYLETKDKKWQEKMH